MGLCLPIFAPKTAVVLVSVFVASLHAVQLLLPFAAHGNLVPQSGIVVVGYAGSNAAVAFHVARSTGSSAS